MHQQHGQVDRRSEAQERQQALALPALGVARTCDEEGERDAEHRIRAQHELAFFRQRLPDEFEARAFLAPNPEQSGDHAHGGEQQAERRAAGRAGARARSRQEEKREDSQPCDHEAPELVERPHLV